ncbi:MAG: hypothetical protein SGJ05_09095 [bacterium]|nr:hypothetical protein [bacterium]
MTPFIASSIFAVLSVFAVAFQIALVFGAPWGNLTLGGKYTGALPIRVRPAAAVSAMLIVIMALIVLIRAQMLLPDLYDLSRTAIWVTVAYLALGTTLNTITPSKSERMLWMPIILVMLAMALVVALY